jgi:hypothetical protein
LHACCRLVGLQGGDLVEERLRVVVAGPQALEVEDADAAEAADLNGGGGAGDSVHGRRHERQLELVGVDLPRDVDILRVPCPPAGNDSDVVEPVGFPT